MLRLTKMKVCLAAAALVILVSNSARAQESRTKPREAKQLSLSEPEQKYDLELSFPIDSDTAINDEGRRERLDQLIQAILQNEELAVNDTLPGTLLDPSSIIFEKTFKCPSGQVVVDEECVPCPPGTYFDEAGQKCTPCAIGFYNPDFAQRACTKCPVIRDTQGVTESEGATSAEKCKQRCSAGHKYRLESELCDRCGFGYYQPEEGQFECLSCGTGLTTRTKTAISEEECRPDCEDGYQMGDNGECEVCPTGTYRTRGVETFCKRCPEDRTTSRSGSKTFADCEIPICVAGHYLNATFNECLPCEIGKYQPKNQETFCYDCPPDSSTATVGSISKDQCKDPCKGANVKCHKHAICLFRGSNDHECQCKFGYKGNGTYCEDKCDGFCRNSGVCLLKDDGEPYCQCAGSFTGEDCGTKSEFAYIAGGIAGAIIFLILLVLLIWMICVRATRPRKPEKVGLGPGAEMAHGHNGHNFYYGAPAPYAESIAPSHHSTYAHYYDDEEDGWDMPNFYNEGYMKDGLAGKMNSLARSNASLYGNKEELYDRLRRHAYQGGKKDKSSNETTSDSDDGRHA